MLKKKLVVKLAKIVIDYIFVKFIIFITLKLQINLKRKIRN